MAINVKSSWTTTNTQSYSYAVEQSDLSKVLILKCDLGKTGHEANTPVQDDNRILKMCSLNVSFFIVSLLTDRKVVATIAIFLPILAKLPSFQLVSSETQLLAITAATSFLINARCLLLDAGFQQLIWMILVREGFRNPSHRQILQVNLSFQFREGGRKHSSASHYFF